MILAKKENQKQTPLYCVEVLKLTCVNVFRYMTEILPITDWSQEAVRPALNLILRRLDRLFSKLSKNKNNLKVYYYYYYINLTVSLV